MTPPPTPHPTPRPPPKRRLPVASDQIITRSNIKTMVDLQKNIQQEHTDTKEHLNNLFAKNGNLKQGQDCAKTFDEQMITQNKKKG